MRQPVRPSHPCSPTVLTTHPVRPQGRPKAGAGQWGYLYLSKRNSFMVAWGGQILSCSILGDSPWSFVVRYTEFMFSTPPGS